MNTKTAIEFFLIFSFYSNVLAEDIRAATAIEAPSNHGGGYYLFSAGPNIPIFYSEDMRNWRSAGAVFSERTPQWAETAIQAKRVTVANRDVWAPDVSYQNGLYYVYYAVSVFGSGRSVIGLAVNRAIRPSDPLYRWEDRGLVIESKGHGKSSFNAIDPNLFVDNDGKWYLFFGSCTHCGGIKMIPINPATGKPFDGLANMVAVANRQRRGGNNEAPFVIRHGNFYYLFVSWDAGCNYKLVVGRATAVGGPYVDDRGRSMLEGGGRVLLGSSSTELGPGHNGVLTTKTGRWLVYQMCNPGSKTKFTRFRPLLWTADGWPTPGEPQPMVLEGEGKIAKRGVAAPKSRGMGADLKKKRKPNL